MMKANREAVQFTTPHDVLKTIATETIATNIYEIHNLKRIAKGIMKWKEAEMKDRYQ